MAKIKRVFVKDMGRMFVPVGQQPAAPVPSLAPYVQNRSLPMDKSTDAAIHKKIQ